MIPTKLYRSLSSSSFQTLLKRGFTPTTKSINEFLLFLSEAHQYKFISHFFHQLNHNCIKGNSQTHTIFAWALLKLGEFDEAEHFMKTQFGNSTNCSKARFWDSLIRGFCIDKKDPDKGLSVLQDCLRNYGIVPSSFTFSVLIRSFSSQGKMDGAMEVLELMNDDKVRYPFSNFVCSSVIAGFSKIGKPELALEIFENAVNVGALRPNLVTYTVLVSALFMLGRVDEFSNLVCRMEKEGLELDVVFYSSWICGYLGEGMLMEAFHRYSEMLNKGISLDTISYTVLIDGFSKEGIIEKTVGFLNKMAQGGLKPNLVTCTAIILGFCRRGKLDEAFTLFRMVEDLGIKVDEFIYAVLIDGVCKAGDIGLAYQLLEEMEKKCIIPSIVTYNTLVNGLCKARRTSEANEASKVMVGDAFMYTTLLHGFIGEGNIVGILDVKQRSEDSGVNMDIVMCNVLIRALFMVGAFEDACALYNRMQELDLAADSVTFCTMIDGCCKVGRIEEALEIFDQSRRTLVSSAACYSCMIRGLCKNGMVDVACEIFIELNERGLPLDTRIYMTLMRDIIKEKGAEGILNLIRRSQNRGINISSAIFNCAISLLCKRNFLVAAIELLLMAKINCSVLTSKSYYLTIKGLITEGKIQLGSCFLSVFIKEYGLLEPKVWNILLHYLCLKDVQSAHFFFNKKKENDPTITFPASALKALARHGRALVAYNLFAGFRDNLSAMDVISYSILVDCLCKEGCLVEALELCAFAQKDRITLNIVTYNSVINGLCLQGCLLEACRLFDSLERIDLVPSEITYATLVDNLCKGGYLVDAKRYLKRMIVKGYEPNTHICNSIIYGYCKFGQIEEAFEILKYMEMKSISLDEYTVSALILGYCQRGDMEEALDLFFDCKRKSITPDFLGFLFLIRGLCAKGRMEEARSVLKEMLLCQTILELINKINVEDELESVGTFLVSLCEQGSIKEAVTVLNEIASIIFPARKHLDQYQELQAPPKLSERDELTAVSPRDSLLLERANFIFPSLNEIGKDNMAESCDMQKRTWCHYIDSYYSLTASLCSQGELSEANEVVKEMLANFDGDC